MTAFHSTADESNACSHETLLHDATCGFKRRDAVNYALNSGVGQHTRQKMTLHSEQCRPCLKSLIRARRCQAPIRHSTLSSKIEVSQLKSQAFVENDDHVKHALHFMSQL